jgi:hypothetical protein
MSPVRSVTYVSGPDPETYGAGDGNRTHVRSLGSLQYNSKTRWIRGFFASLGPLNWKMMENGKRGICAEVRIARLRYRPSTARLPSCLIATDVSTKTNEKIKLVAQAAPTLERLESQCEAQTEG